MLKFIVVVVLLCWEVQEISGQQSSRPTDTLIPPLSPKPTDDLKNEAGKYSDAQQKVPLSLGQYNYAQQQTFYFWNPLAWKTSTNFGNVDKGVRTDYTMVHGIGAHKVHRRKLTWNAARQMCIQEGAHLAVIRTIEEAKAVKSLMAKDSILFAWVGFHDLFQEGDWVTVMDEPLASLEWDAWAKSPPYQYVPDNHNGNEGCTEFVANVLGLNDLNCDLLYPFVCKIDI